MVSVKYVILTTLIEVAILFIGTPILVSGLDLAAIGAAVFGIVAIIQVGMDTIMVVSIIHMDISMEDTTEDITADPMVDFIVDMAGTDNEICGFPLCLES